MTASRVDSTIRLSSDRGESEPATIIPRINGSYSRWPSPGWQEEFVGGRLGLALDLPQDPALDTLLTGTSHFDESAEVMKRLASGDLPALCHVDTYDEGGLACSA